MEGEVTVICMDICSWMGDHKSQRFLDQVDAIELYCKEKIDCHPENCVGILAMGGKEIYNVVEEPTRDLQMIMTRIHCLRVESYNMKILDALKRADEYLKKNKLQKRIAVFAGGPVFYFKYSLKELGSQLKDGGVAVDVVNFGDHQGPPGRWIPGRPRNEKKIAGESKKEILEALVDAVNHDDNSNILHVPEDEFSLRDHLSRSRMIVSREWWEQCNSLESVNKRQKRQIDTLTQKNEKLKQELELFRTELSKFFQKVQGDDQHS